METHAASYLRRMGLPAINVNGIPKLDYEQSVIDFAKRVLDDIPECRDAKYSVRWQQNVHSKQVVPFLVIAFEIEGSDDMPAIAMSLVIVEKGTLLQTLPGKKLLEGDRLRDAILRNVHHYMNAHGIVLTPHIG